MPHVGAQSPSSELNGIPNSNPVFVGIPLSASSQNPWVRYPQKADIQHQSNTHLNNDKTAMSHQKPASTVE